MKYQEILKFWFDELTPQQHFKKDPQLDESIKSRFSAIHSQARCAELFSWRQTPEGSLAEIIVLDQFSRNIYRNTAQAFSQDPLALALSQFAVQQGFDKPLPASRLSFLYMPYMHSESLGVHEKAVELFSHPELEGVLDFEIKHKKIIEKFGRYPHRNKVLGRVSTDKELKSLQQPGSGF